MTRKTVLIAILLLACLFGLMPAARAVESDALTSAPAETTTTEVSDAAVAPATSHRLIVELTSPSLSEWAQTQPDDAALWHQGGLLNVDAPAAQAYLGQLAMEQNGFTKQLSIAVPGARVSSFLDEYLRPREARYQIVMNGMSIDAGLSADVDALEAQLWALPGVKTVYRDYAHEPTMYASLPLINAQGTWNLPDIGGIDNAGTGVRLSSMDGGIHHAGMMFKGDGYEYPPGYPLGHLDNTNGKIIASRAYFRDWDPPAPGDENPWPGMRGTPHGQHTSSTAVGNPIETEYLGHEVAVSGVAPKAFAMSYRVFYYSTQGIGSVYSTEGVMAMEDQVRDGAQVSNNSWGGGAAGIGGEYAAMDKGLLGLWNAGVFVSLSAGNAGPMKHTTDHPSDEYITVANSTHTGAFGTEGVSAVAPMPVVSDTLKNIAFAAASFGGPVTANTLYGPYGYASAASVDPANFEGCLPYPDGAFDGKLALISRGGCQFGTKALNAENAGAVFAIIHNHAEGGDALVSMSGGDEGDQVTIPAIFIGHTYGTALTDWHAMHPDTAQLHINTNVVQIGNTPDYVVAGSSRGPAVLNRLKPDIAAPGTNILAEGYSPGSTGEDRHIGLGQASGTSMASPHVAGAAALLRQVHPDWSSDAIKSALMSTSKYLEMYAYTEAGTRPAQPLDMGAGRLDLTNATDPGVILSPPSLSFGQVAKGVAGEIEVMVTSVAEDTETYTLSSVDTSGGFTDIPAVAGLSFEPETFTITPGQTVKVTVSWDTDATANEYGDNQGYLVLASDNYEAHMASWIRVGHRKKLADVLVIDSDGSGLPLDVRELYYGVGTAPTFTNYTPYYTETLEALGLTYEVYDADAQVTTASAANAFAQHLPAPWDVMQYDLVLHHTGDSPLPVISTGGDQQLLREYTNHGTPYIGFGQDMASVFSSATDDPTGGTTFYNGYLGAEYLQDSINAEEVMTTTSQLLFGSPGSWLAGMAFDVSARGDGAGNQVFIDEIRPTLSASQTELEDVQPLMLYSGGIAEEDGYIAMSQRERKTLERPGYSWLGQTLYFAFGLEGINDDTGFATRGDLMEKAVAWALDDTTITISATVGSANQVTSFAAEAESEFGTELASLRWDFGDGTEFTPDRPVNGPADPADPPWNAGHTYRAPGVYTVRVEATNALGNKFVTETEITVPDVSPEGPTYVDRYWSIYTPLVSKSYALTP